MRFSLDKLALLPGLMKPSFIGGTWRPATISGRKLNAIRKEAAVVGLEFPIPETPMRAAPTKAPKGHKFEAEKQKRYVRFCVFVEKEERRVMQRCRG